MMVMMMMMVGAVAASTSEYLGDEFVLAAHQETGDVALERVPVLLQEVVDVVGDVSRVMSDDKLGVAHFGFRVAHFRTVMVMAFLQEGIVGAFGEITFVV